MRLRIPWKATAAADGRAGLERAAELLRNAVVAGSAREQMAPLFKGLEAAIAGAPRTAVEAAMVMLADAAREAPLAAAAAAVLGCGRLLSAGASPEPAVEPVVDRTAEATARAAEFEHALDAGLSAERQAGRPLDDQRIDEIVRLASERMPEQAVASKLLRHFCAPLVDLMLESKAARTRARRTGLRTDLMSFQLEAGSPEADLLPLLGGLDDDLLLVLCPLEGRAYRAVASGVTHNFQLQLLLADALLGDPAQGLLTGARPDPRLLAAAKDRPWPQDAPPAQVPFHVQDLRAVARDGSIDFDPLGHVVLGEAFPADIPQLDGARVLVLSPSRLKRTFKAPRDFANLKGELAVIEKLDAAATRAFIERIARAAGA